MDLSEPLFFLLKIRCDKRTLYQLNTKSIGKYPHSNPSVKKVSKYYTRRQYMFYHITSRHHKNIYLLPFFYDVFVIRLDTSLGSEMPNYSYCFKKSGYCTCRTSGLNLIFSLKHCIFFFLLITTMDRQKKYFNFEKDELGLEEKLNSSTYELSNKVR